MRGLKFHIRQGLDLGVQGRPAERAPEFDAPLEAKSTTRVARLGLDDIAVKPEIAVQPGVQVQAGDILWRDRRRPEIRFTAPASGTVVAVNRGAKRKLISVVIEPDGSAAKHFTAPDGQSPEAVRDWLLDTGLWTALRARPYGIIPASGDTPLAVFVTATEPDPLGPDPAAVIDQHADAFLEGLKTLTRIGAGPVVLCVHPGLGLGPLPDGVRRAEFSGTHAAALPGTHIHRICPVGWHGQDAGLDGQAWHIGYQDVISIGTACLSGTPWNERVVALAGPHMTAPRVLRVPLGACVGEVLDGELAPGATRIIAGGALNGRAAFGMQDFLSPRHTVVTALAENVPAAAGGTALGGRPGSVLPVPDVERAWPFDIPVTPLMRALAVGDGETVRALGGLALIEEDVAALTFACPSKSEYGVLLRRVLDEAMKAEEAGA